MPQNCKKVPLTEVIKFFVEDIDGTGKHDGFPRNEGVPDVLRLCREWSLCELSEVELMHLLNPDGSNTLIGEKDINTTEGDSRETIEKYLAILEAGGEIPALIVRTKLQGEREDSSFYIEDGAHRAIALKVYSEKNPYKLVKAYIGERVN